MKKPAKMRAVSKATSTGRWVEKGGGLALCSIYALKLIHMHLKGC